MQNSNLSLNLSNLKINKQTGMLLAIAAGSVLILALFHFMFIAGNARQLAELSSKLMAAQEKAALYTNFEEFKQKLELHRERVANVLAAYDPQDIPTQLVAQSFLEHVGKLCDREQLRFDRVNPYKLQDGTLMWNISFAAGYAKTLSFLFALERYYKINDLAIRSDNSAKYRVDLTVAAIPYSRDVSERAKDMTGFKDLADVRDQADELLNGIEAKRMLAETVHAAVRDPFQGKGLSSGDRDERKEVVQRPNVRLEGILWDPQKPMAIIEGRVVGVGGEIQGARVVKITRGGVQMNWRSQTFTLRLDGKKEAP